MLVWMLTNCTEVNWMNIIRDIFILVGKWFMYRKYVSICLNLTFVS